MGDSNAGKAKVLGRSFYDRDPAIVARELLGKRLCRRTKEGLTAGRIVEAEAYLSIDDPACHAAKGRNKKNATMFGPPGHAYVYVIHARFCVNVVTEEHGTPSAVLIRALEPLAGIPLMQARRQREKLLDLARGPARLCEALAITRQLDGWDLTLGRQLWLEADQEDAPHRLSVLTSPRIGVTSGEELHLRFSWADCPYVSGGRARFTAR
jgi:DNA-3-methyladenine glycosylase